MAVSAVTASADFPFLTLQSGDSCSHFQHSRKKMTSGKLG
jgi:hypothetical protein